MPGLNFVRKSPNPSSMVLGIFAHLFSGFGAKWSICLGVELFEAKQQYAAELGWCSETVLLALLEALASEIE